MAKAKVTTDVNSSGELDTVPGDNVVVPEGIPELKELVVASTGLGFVPNNFNEVFEHFAGELVEIEGSPYTVIQKATLVDKPFVITDVRFYEGTYGPAVAICGITEENMRFVFNDGSTGIFEAIKRTVAKTRRTAGILVPKGLRASTYKVTIKDPFNEDDEGKEIDATTYYFA